MKQKAGPVPIIIAAVAIVALLIFLYRKFLPPPPPPDDIHGAPAYVKMAHDFIKNHKPGDPLPGMHGGPGGSMGGGAGHSPNAGR